MNKLFKQFILLLIISLIFSFTSHALAADLEKIPDVASMKYFTNIEKVGGSLYGKRIVTELERIPDVASMKYFTAIKKIGSSLYGQRISSHKPMVVDNSTVGLEKIPDVASMKYFTGIKKVNGSLYGKRIINADKPVEKVVESLSSCQELTNCLKYRNVEIVWEVPENVFYTVGKNISANANGKYSEETIAVIKKTLDKYPQGLLNRYLNRIYLLDSLTVDNLRSLGVADSHNRRLFVVVDQSNILTEQIIHHELAHILSLNPDNSYWAAISMKKEFAAVNPADFKYGSLDIYRATNNIQSYSPRLAQQGFLTYYSTVNIEEDIAQFATRMFKDDNDSLGTDFWALVDSSPKLQEKLKIMLKFYSERDSQFFTENYFRTVSGK